MSNLSVIDLESTKNDFLWEQARFRTFTKWPFKVNTPCLASNMAAAGWYCTSSDPEDPSAKCAFCLKELSGWEITDDPWQEHLKHNRECSFIKLGKTENNCTFADIFHLLEARMLKIAEMVHIDKIKKLREMKDNLTATVDNS